MIRTFGVQTLSGSAQPWFGDALTAAFSNTRPASGLYTAQVANTAIYRIGDRIILGYGQAGQNCLLVNTIIDGTHLGLQSEGNAPVSAWGNGAKIALDIACAQVLFNAIVGNTANVWLGADSTVTNSGGGSAFVEFAAAATYTFGLGRYNYIRTSEGWMAGALNDKVGVAAVIV